MKLAITLLANQEGVSMHQDKVIYQIYPRSFKDTDGDGVGDLPGIISELDFLETLGIDIAWLSPIFPSPQYDNGYDVADYKAINPLFGTMTDFETLVEEAEQRGIGIMLDMVLNHCSTEHEWFQKALAGDKYYQEFFYLRPAKEDGSLPTNWESKFGGPAWAPFGDTDLYYLHLYDVHQADLNWHNPNVRRELHDVVRFWMDKGVQGFRFDVLNVIGKSEEMVDSKEPGSNEEKALYTDTPIVHEWVQELNQATYGKNSELITVGEMSSTDVPNGIQYTNPERNELDMIFSFHHLKVDYEEGEKWSNPEFDFLSLKAILNEWQEGMSDGDGWNAVFYNNHDQPRANSRFGDVENFPFETATMLAQSIHLMRGTPYIYQGEEIGMTNPMFEEIDDYDDIETRNHYRIMIEKGKTHDEAMEIIQAKSRDNSRTPMQWTDDHQAGFTTGEPWLKLADNYSVINAQNELENDNIFKYYQKLIALRKEYSIISQGSYEGLALEHPEIMAYNRHLDGHDLIVLTHYYPGESSIEIPERFLNRPYRRLIGNGAQNELTETVTLGDYETVAFLIE
ncbi:alpha,alpha-phosphotrehalase [Aerococcaceae bacterium DSM 111020]|nr:alpha,alpha-phosphotrehalase [Aerococcaceae bacterium DSM 111020]